MRSILDECNPLRSLGACQGKKGKQTASPSPIKPTQQLFLPPLALPTVPSSLSLDSLRYRRYSASGECYRSLWSIDERHNNFIVLPILANIQAAFLCFTQPWNLLGNLDRCSKGNSKRVQTSRFVQSCGNRGSTADSTGRFWFPSSSNVLCTRDKFVDFRIASYFAYTIVFSVSTRCSVWIFSNTLHIFATFISCRQFIVPRCMYLLN